MLSVALLSPVRDVQAQSAGAAPVAPSVFTMPTGGQSTDNGTANRIANSSESGSDQARQRQNEASAEDTQNALRRNDTTPAERLTEFQQLVASTTGRTLPIFGASLFGRTTPSTFAPVMDIPVTPDYVIGPGDELRLAVWGQVNQEGSFRVDRTGAISVPQLGTIHVAGLKFSQITEYLRGQLGRVYRNFDLNVNLGQLRTIPIFVVGQARRPGSYTISSLSTLLNALFASGGPTPQGSLRHIQVKRGSGTVVDFDLYDLLLHGDKSKDVGLSPGDVIFIPTVGPQVALVGSVTNPAIYELRDETTIAQLLDLAGGRTSSAAGTQVRLERIFEHASRSIVDVDLAKAETPSLQNGDVISVSAIVDHFKDAVTLRGNVANPGRYVWRAGMRITDLLPSREALVTRDYWRKRNLLGQMTSDYGPQFDTATEGSLQVKGNAASASADNAVQRGAASSDAGGNSVGVALTQTNGTFGAKTDVVLSAPDINWGYAVVERQSATNLTTSLLPFNLGRVVLNGDQSQNLELLPGDVVTIFSTADLRVPTTQQTRFVRLEGEFVASGVYSVNPGETLLGLLKRAGGFTEDAYLYGSEFTRQSTRRVEQQRLREYADQLDAQIQTQTAGNNARALSDRDAAAANAAALDAKAAVARLRQIAPVGRIVLQLKPDSRDIGTLPDIALEDGDRFVVPKVPSNVNVEGQVYSANAFVFERSKRAFYYLKQAGGPDRQADKRRTFILRADGSVLSRQYGNVEHALIFPGDTVVVPPQLEKRAFLRDVLNIANIVGQFGLGAAAINVLK